MWRDEMWGKASERQKKKKYFILLLISMVLFSFGIYAAEAMIKPVLIAVAEIKARSMVAQTVNEVLREKYDTRGGFEDILDIRMDEIGKVSLIQANSSVMNKLSYDLAWEIQQGLIELKEDKVLLPLGSILGSPILSQTGPKVKIKVLPMGVTKISYKTELTDAGINQTKYKVYLDVMNTAKIVVPFSNKQIDAKTTILIAEAVIIGDIPESYIVVVPDDIMDAANP